MNVAMRQERAEVRDHGLDRNELRARTLPLIVAASFLAVLGLIFDAMTRATAIPPELVGIIVVLVGAMGLTHLSSQKRPHLAAYCLIGGMLLALALALHLWPDYLVAPWLALVVLLAGALLGSRGAAATAFATTVGLHVAAQQASPLITWEVCTATTFLLWSSVLVHWLISQPAATALDWAWESYRQAVERTQEARERQAELARLSKSLSESYYRLEQLNGELVKAREVAQEARRLKAQFAAAVSHELRTPLNLVIGFCEMMVLSPDTAYGQRMPSSYRGDLEAIYRNACHISALVDDILDLSQIDADRMALHREWTTLEQIVGDAVATVETLFHNRELTLRALLPEDMPPLFVDGTRIRQILINLLNNAARFTEEGGVTIRAERQDGEVVVAVSDSGPGIPAGELPHVFEEFRQVGGAGRPRGGSGLGLTVSRRFAELHGGTMWVESEPGQGSTFFLRLPLGETDELRHGQSGTDWGDRVAARVRGQTSRRVLVVDETRQVSRVFQRYLDACEVLHADTVSRGQRLCRGKPVHAVILGSPKAKTQWQGLTGSFTECDGPLVISCSMHTPRRLAEQLGVADYLVKPVSRQQLRNALRRLNRTLRRVLVVDDDHEMSRLLERMIKSICHGCEVRTAEDGSRALQLLGEWRPDAIVLDLLMPGKNGYEVIEAIHGQPVLSATPILVITARGHDDEMVVASEVHFTRENGLSVAELMQLVKSGLDVAPWTASSELARPAAPGA